jgi:hypothetical protein
MLGGMTRRRLRFGVSKGLDEAKQAMGRLPRGPPLSYVETILSTIA